MEIIAKTNNGYILSASETDVREILAAVMGSAPKEIPIGQKIPAIDYSSTIRKIGALKTNYTWTSLLAKVTDFNDMVDNLKNAVDSAADLE
jgi:hypothetical protein